MKNFFCSKILLIPFLLLGSIALSYSQVIQGTVTTSDNTPINAQILLKEPSNDNVIKEFILVTKGTFTYKLKKSYSTNSFFLTVKATGYTDYTEEIKILKPLDTLNFKFVLFKEKIEYLNEVVVEKKKAFTIKEDTVTYNVDSYVDGTERKVEDLLKKLPGIEVDSGTGNISYRGKSIETVTIEGDNLFDYNYTIGTKNINIDLIEEIEAIENYSENRLLKGIENSQKVALNLKLKKDRSDISGSIDIGLGGFTTSKKSPLDVSTNLLAINKIHKSFAVSTYNTIGKNSSPFNYSGNQITQEQLKDEKYYIQSIIPEYNINQVTNNNLSNQNSQLFTNFNSIYKLNDKLKAKVNLYYLLDKINSNQFSESIIITGNEHFAIFDDNHINKKPLQYRGDLELKYNTSKTSLLEYNVSFRDETIDTEYRTISNQENDFNSLLNTQNKLFKQNLEYTNKVSENKALQINLANSFNNLDQNFTIDPSVFNTENFNSDIQSNSSKKYYTAFKTVLLGKSKKNNKYSVLVGFNLDKETFYSNLISKNNTQELAVDGSLNDVNFIKNGIYTQGSYNWKIGKFSFSPKLSFQQLYQEFEGATNPLDENIFIFEPSLSVMYKFNGNSYLNLNTGFNQNSQEIQNVFENQVLISNRMVKNNIPDITTRKNQKYSLMYSKNDLFNQLTLSFGVDYLKQKGNYFSDTDINENAIKTTSFFLNEYTDNTSFFLNFSKLIPSIKTNFKISSNYSIYNYKNIINNSGLRDNKALYLFNSLFLKTAFNSSINFENTTKFTYQETVSQSLFVNRSLENNFKLLFKPSRSLFSTVSYNYFIPNFTDKDTTNSFLNFDIMYRPQNKNWQLGLKGVNLLDNTSFIQRNVNEFSINSQKTNLLGRYYLLNYMYSF
ncbi:hypothetical protein [Cellulophaga fucicola]|uniref:Outer membrane receptor proteins, mostly Fe transport n=1 Tax=Cellulophaga fucicola TaxID=76595 RepID=A0A1K1MM19_9FLAO|nr:hypothetical protein [Cellulophaga fucicola]SFW22974.1 hypothetical protein SAMN05660313_00644 [Cellulophaga fucicola]